MLKFFQKKNTIEIKEEKSIFDEYANIKDAAGFYSVIGKLPNPDIILRKTGKGLKTLRELKSNYQVGTCIESRKSGVTGKNWKLLKEDCSDKEFDFYNNIFKNLDVHKMIEDILEAPLFGYTPMEITYEKINNYIVPTKITAKPQEWFYFDSEGNFYFNSKSRQDGLLILPENPKFILPRHRSDYLNPYGECLLSRCFWNVAFINGGMEFWLKFMEKYGMPWAIGKYDRLMSDSERKDLFNMLKRMVQDCISVIPKDGSVELMSSPDKAGSNTVYQTFITKCENNISKVILGQTLTTDVGSTGSYAASNTHQEVRGDLIQNDVRLCENTIDDFISKIHSLNFNNSEYPKIKLYDDEEIDQSVAERDNKVKSLGVKFTKKYIQKAYGYEDDDFELEETTTNNESVNFADSIFDDDFNKMENIIRNLSKEDYERMINDSLKPIFTLFNQTRDAEECMEKLAEIYPGMKTEELEKTLTKVIFLAELLGQVD